MSVPTFRSFLLRVRSTIATIFAISFILQLSAAPAFAATGINRAFNYQGRLFSSSGSLVADGTYAMKFSLYDSSTGGTRLWTAAGTTGTPTTVNVTVTNGLFTVLMGDTGSGQNALTIDWNQDGLYLGVTVGTDTEMTPRKRLTAVPYAFNAETLQGNYASSSIAATGGNLMALRQNATDSASAARTSLFVQNNGTSNLNDYLIKGNNGSSDVFTINRQGNVTTTGNLSVSGSTALSALTASQSTSTQLAFTSASGSSLVIAGKQVCLADGTNCQPSSGSQSLAQVAANGATTTATLDLFGGFLAASSTVTSTFTVLGDSSLQNFTWSNATGTSVTSTNLFSTNGMFTNLTSSNASLTDLTMSNGTSTGWFGFVTASGTTLNAASISVNGSGVCLLNGLNCPAGALAWTDDATNNLVTLTNPARNVLLGGNTTSTAGFIWEPTGLTSGTSSLILGGATNTNVYVGTSTYGGGLDPNFSMSGKDLFVQGKIGSIGGLYSATSVIIGQSTFINDGVIYKDTPGDFALTLNDLTSSFRINTGGTNGFTVASSGHVGIGVANPTSAFEVAGGITTKLVPGSTTFSVVTSTSLTSLLQNSAAIAVVGNTAYVGDGPTHKLLVVDVSRTAAPVVLGSLVVGTMWPNDIAVQGHYAYISDDNGALQVVDISNSASPAFVTSLTLPEPNQIVVSGHTLFMTDFGGFLESVDITHPEHPELMQQIAATSATFLALQGQYAYVTSGFGGATVQTFDVTNPHAMVDHGAVLLSGAPMGIVASGQYAYVADQTGNHLFVLDLTTPTTPVLANTIAADAAPYRLALFGNALISSHIATHANVFDLSQPGTPVYVNSIPLAVSNNYTITVSGHTAYIPSADGALSIIDLNGFEVNSIHAGTASFSDMHVQGDAAISKHLDVGSSLDVAGDTRVHGALLNGVAGDTNIQVVSSTAFVTPQKLRIVGNYGYLVDYDSSKLNVLDVTDPRALKIIGSVTIPLGASLIDVAVQGHYAFLIDDWNAEMDVVDISVPVHPVLVTTLPIGLSPERIEIQGKYAYVNDTSSATLNVIDISTPTSPSIVHTVTGIGSKAFGLGILGTHAYVGSFSGLKVIDISTPTTASILGSAAGSFKDQMVGVSDRYVYVSVNNGIDVFDVSTSTPPVLVNTLKANGFPEQLVVQGNTLYAANSNGNLQIFDVTDPTTPAVGSVSPQLIKTVSVGTNLFDVVVKGRYAYVVDQGGGKVFVLDVGGFETHALSAGNADLGSLQVGIDAHVGNNLTIGGQLTVAGKTVCLADGTNCPASSSAAPSSVASYASPWADFSPQSIATFGKTAFIVGGGDVGSRIEAVDISVPNNPIDLSRLVLASIHPLSVVTNGKYAYVSGSSGVGNGKICVVDVSNPENMQLLNCSVTAPGTEAYPNKLQLSGNTLYAANYAVGFGNVSIYDLSDPKTPTLIGEFVLGSSWPIGMKVQDGYLYTLSFSHILTKVDLSDLTNPVSVWTANVGGDYGTDLDVVGNFAYILRTGVDSGTSNFTIYDVARSTAPLSAISNTLIGNAPKRIFVSGRYAYTTSNTNQVRIYDVQDTTAPTLGTTLTAGTGATPIALEGRTLLVGNTTANTLSLFDAGGIEVSGLVAHSAELGSMKVLGDGAVDYDFSVGGGLSVGPSGISSLGALSVSSLTSTSTFSYGLTAMNGAFSQMLQVGGVNVCLQNGTNCPSSSSYWSYNVASDTLTTISPTSTVSIGGNITNLLEAGRPYPTMSTTTVGTYPLGAAIVGTTAYVTNVLSNSVSILDVSNVHAPAVLSTLTVGTRPADVKAYSHYIYTVNANSNDVSVVDVSNPVSPALVKTVAVGGSPNAIAISGSHAYVANNTSSTVSVLDLADPAAPIIAATVSVGTAPNSIAVSGHYVLTANHDSNNVSIIDVANPASPSVVSTPAAGTWPYWVAVSGRYAYVANAGSQTMSVFDITNPASPTTATTTSVGSFPSSITISGRYAYVFNHLLNGLHVYDITDPTTPVLIDTPTGFGNGAYVMPVSGRYGFLPNTADNSFSIVDLGGVETNGLKAASAELGSLTVNANGYVANKFRVGNGLDVGPGGIVTNGTLTAFGKVTNLPASGSSFSIAKTVTGLTGASGVAVQGKYAYVANNAGNSFSILDISDPSHASTVTSTSVSGGPFAVAVAGRYAFTANSTGNSVSILDISDPMAASVTGTVSVGLRPTDIAISGRYVYTANYFGNSVSILDVSRSPSVVATVSLAGTSNPYAIAVAGRYAYTANYNDNTMSIIDVADPLNATVASTTAVISHPTGVKVQGRYAYVSTIAGGTGGVGTVQIYDISDPTTPRLVGSADAGSTSQQITVAGRYAYLPDYSSNTVSVIDVSSSTAPYRVGTATVGTNPLNVAVSGQYAYAANAGSGSVSIIDLGGTETNALTAHSALLGTLNVISDATVSNDFTVMGALNVGSRGIFAQGSVGIFATTAGASALNVTNSASTTAAVLSVTGRCDETAGAKLFELQNKNGNGFSFNCDGNAYSHLAFNAGGADFAEYFVASGVMPTMGDVVSLAAPSGTVALASATGRDHVLGVVSTRPGFVGNANLRTASSTVIVGFVGQIPTHVSATSSAIAAGDWLMAGDNGVAVKAQGPGMVIGRAIDPLSSGTGTIMVAVQPMWWAGDLFSSIATEAHQVTDIVAQSATTADALHPLIDSPAYTFRGSAWDAAVSAPVFQSFSLFAAPQTSSSSLFTIANTSGTSLLTISDLGNASVTNDLTVGGRLFLSSKSLHAGSTSTYLFIDDTAPSSTFISTNADGFQTLSTYDYAERYSSTDDLVPGDVVTADNLGINMVRRATSTAETVLGIVSTRPGFVTGSYATDTYPIALAGRVPTRVSTKNGAIHVGDTLMASDIPGVAVKAVGAGNTVGVALESYDHPEEGLISVFVKAGWQNAAIAETGSAVTNAAPVSSGLTRTGLAKVYAGSTSVKVTFPTLNAFPIIQATPYGEAKGGYWFTNVSDNGFTITLGQAPTFDLLFAWSVQPSASGANIYYSDNTSAAYDPLTGNAIPTTPTASSTTSAATTTVTVSDAVSASSTTTTLP